jgi:hypothetical protein
MLRTPIQSNTRLKSSKISPDRYLVNIAMTTIFLRFLDINRATVAFRNAARTLLSSQSFLGAQYRRLRTRLGAPKAITGMARKLACLCYRLIKHGQQYVDKRN